MEIKKVEIEKIPFKRTKYSKVHQSIRTLEFNKGLIIKLNHSTPGFNSTIYQALSRERKKGIKHDFHISIVEMDKEYKIWGIKKLPI